MITGGLGIQFAGGAIGQALRDMSPTIVMVASDFTVIANLARLYIWWQALRVKAHSSCTRGERLPEIKRSSHAHDAHGCVWCRRVWYDCAVLLGFQVAGGEPLVAPLSEFDYLIRIEDLHFDAAVLGARFAGAGVVDRLCWPKPIMWMR